MHPRSSSKTSSRRAPALLATAALSCGTVIAGVTHAPLEFQIDGPGGAAIVATWNGVVERDDLDIGVAGALTHLGAEPCHVAVYLHDSRPDRADIPTLTGPPAPELPGELIFEAVLLPPRDGVVFTREIGSFDASGLFSWPEAFHHFPGEPPTTHRFVTFATCADPDIRVELDLSLGFARPERLGGDDEVDAMHAEKLWP